MFSKVFKGAIAYIKGGDEFPNINGIVYFKQTKNGILLTTKINGLPTSKTNCNRKIFWISYT